MSTESEPLVIRGAILVAVWSPAVALFLYLLGGAITILGTPFLPESTLLSLQHLYGHTCHQIADRSFSAGAAQMAFCARCTGFYGGLALLSLCVVVTGRTRAISFTWLVAGSLLMVVDVIFDLSLRLDWPNLGRVINGFVAGAAVALFAYPRYLAALRYSLAHRQGRA